MRAGTSPGRVLKQTFFLFPPLRSTVLEYMQQRHQLEPAAGAEKIDNFKTRLDSVTSSMY